jgi:hypothetical protein
MDGRCHGVDVTDGALPAKGEWRRRGRLPTFRQKDPPMNVRMFAALPFAIAMGVLASAPSLAQDTMPASSASAMSQDGMQHKDAMKDSMHKHRKMMEKDAMQGDTMKHMAAHHGTTMKKGDSMKMKQSATEPMSSGG